MQISSEWAVYAQKPRKMKAMGKAHIAPHGIEANATNNQLVASLKHMHLPWKESSIWDEAFLSISQPLGLNPPRRLR